VTEFKYLGSNLTEKNENKIEIKARLMAGNRCYYTFQKLLRSSLISHRTKIRIYRTVIRPTVMYGAETWVLTNADENALNIWERKIYGPVQDAGIWRIRTNK
jgi:hypothetical protein